MLGKKENIDENATLEQTLNVLENASEENSDKDKKADSKQAISSDEEVLGMEEMDKLYEESMSSFDEGQIITGKIVSISNKDVFVDIGYKSDGIVQISEFLNPEELVVGNEITVLLEQKEDENGVVVLSKQKAERSEGWDKIINNYNEGDNIEGVVIKKVKGGFMINIGIDAFLPASLAMPREFSGDYLRKKYTFKIVKVNKPRKNVVLSRRDFVNEERESIKREALKTIEKGSTVKGLVKNITDFGAFIDIGRGVIGLLHITDMSWGRISHPSDIVAVGQELDVMILDFDKDNMKISLGLKQMSTNPWEGTAGKYPVSLKVKGKVVNLMPYGAFIELEKGIEGLVHISELSWSKKHNHPNEVLELGQEIEVIILEVDEDSRKISLGIKQLEEDPWKTVVNKYTAGDKIQGKVISLTDYGAFVELEKGIDGLVHVSDISWTKKITHPKDVIKKGDTIQTMILSVDEANRRIALGVKQLESDPWDDITVKFSPGTEIKGKVTKVTNFGIFVEIDKDLEGLLHISETGLSKTDKIEEKFNTGDDIEVVVLRVDGVQKKIALSLKGELPKIESPSEEHAVEIKEESADQEEKKTAEETQLEESAE